ncbi:hypothetical protein [Fundidesulfovibrio agrisoli]|uniref:hypothetical protein n=1 Tax=Fundidesulfovibrio agrisoli TaxID=2922717 RepID=UPI001FAE5B43|nr:hypothetical protein [Fundidesulfovibrio agrisoli]
MMEHYLGKLPEPIRRLAMPAMAREIKEFTALYSYLRKAAVIIENHQRLHSGKNSARFAAEESGNRFKSRKLTQAEQAERRELVRRVKSGGARDGDLLRYLELSVA